jgi:sec-independent protein translocase protein TatA
MTTGLLNPTHIVILLIAALIILGPKRLPQAGRSLGRGMREFRDGISGRDDPTGQPQAPPAMMTAPPPASPAPITPAQTNSQTEPTPTVQGRD